LALAPNWQIATATQIAMGLTFYMFHGVLQARATEALPEARGAAVSAFALALFLGQGIGALAFGALLATGGYRHGFMAAAVAMLALTIWCRLRLAVQPQSSAGLSGNRTTIGS
jgi:predicted MFS family arabinose efflux permease